MMFHAVSVFQIPGDVSYYPIKKMRELSRMLIGAVLQNYEDLKQVLDGNKSVQGVTRLSPEKQCALFAKWHSVDVSKLYVNGRRSCGVSSDSGI